MGSLEGIVKHNGPVLPLKSNEKIPYTIQKFQSDWDLGLTTFASAEAQIAAIADDIAYSTHDIDDSFRMNRLTLAELCEAPMIGEQLFKARKMYPETEERRLIYVAVSQMMSDLIDDLLVTARQNLAELNPNSVDDIRLAKSQIIRLSEEKAKDLKALKGFLMEHVFKSELMLQIRTDVQGKLKFLFQYYFDDPTQLPDDWYECYLADHNLSQDDKAKVIADYIAGMTDRFALKKYDEVA
jgi:dGTPase